MNSTAKYTKLIVENILTYPLGFKWSVQGLGMMRVYLSSAVRLHIWDSALKVPGVSAIHSHPWDLESHVIAGIYRQRRYTAPYPNQVANPELRTFSQAEIQCGENACVVGDVAEISLIEGAEEVYRAGQYYAQSKDEIHLSHADDGTVTLVERAFHPDRDHALVLWSGKGGWIDAKPRRATEEEIVAVCSRSLNWWF